MFVYELTNGIRGLFSCLECCCQNHFVILPKQPKASTFRNNGCLLNYHFLCKQCSSWMYSVVRYQKRFLLLTDTLLIGSTKCSFMIPKRISDLDDILLDSCASCKSYCHMDYSDPVQEQISPNVIVDRYSPKSRCICGHQSFLPLGLRVMERGLYTIE